MSENEKPINIEQEISAPELKPAAESLPLPEDFVNRLEEKGLSQQADAYNKAVELAKVVKDAGGRALLVGGYVRDLYFGKISKDIDIEVYGLPTEKLREVVNQVGKTSEVGKAFGVLKVSFGEGLNLDVSLPRKDSKVGPGHRGFDVETDPNMSMTEAARRRDFTMNSMAADPLTGEIFDPFGGLQDIKERRLRVTDPERFKDDPLRVLRGLQFIGRFGLELDKDSEDVMREMIPLLPELPKERLQEEWQKLLLKSEKPSLGLSAGMTLGVFRELHPELHVLADVPQDPLWHPEGNAWLHTLKVVDEAAEIIRREQLESKDAWVVMLAALCHDLGKATTTREKEGRIISHEHEQAGKEPTQKFLESIGADNLTMKKVVPLVTEHLAPTMRYTDEVIREQKVSDGAIRRLAKKIYPATILELVAVAEADHLGRGPYDTPEAKEQLMIPANEYPPREWLLERARKIAVEDSQPADLTQGRDWIAMGYRPGPEFSQLIKLANELRDDKEYTREQVFQAVDEIADAKRAIEKLKELLAA